MTALLEMLKSRQTKGPSFASPLREDTFALTDPKSALLEFKDDAKFPRAKYVISSMDIDREGDSMLPEGCLATLDEYRTNAVVLWDHQSDMPAIANSVGPAGEFGIEIKRGSHIEAWAWFHKLTKESRDHALMAKYNVIKGTSIGFLPNEGERLPQAGRRKGGHLFTDWTLTEWSLTNVPMNPKAIKISKSLRLENPVEMYTRKSWSNGVTLENPMEKYCAIAFDKSSFTKMKAIQWLKQKKLDGSACEDRAGQLVFTQSAEKPGNRTLIAKGIYGFIAKANTPEEDEEIDKEDNKEEESSVSEEESGEGAEQSEKPKEEEAKSAEEAATEGVGPDNMLKPHAQTMANIIGHHRGVGDYIKSMIDPGAHPKITKALMYHGKNADEMAEHMMGVAKDVYPDVDLESHMNKADDNAKENEGAENEEDKKDKAAKGIITKGFAGKHGGIIKAACDSMMYHAKALGDLVTGAGDADDLDAESEKPAEEVKDDMDEESEMEKRLAGIEDRMLRIAQ